MEPNLQQSGGDQPNPQILALTKAIGQAESGGDYNASGDGGNSIGAYQMSPSFIEKWAPTAGVQYQPGQPLDPETQNRVAYNAVKTMATSGDPGYEYLGQLSPAQIASAWNAGDPNAYLDPEYGKNNKYGSTANYVTKVEEFANANSQPASPTNTAQASTGSPTGTPQPPTWGNTGNPIADWMYSPQGLATLVGAPVLGAGLAATGGGLLAGAAGLFGWGASKVAPFLEGGAAAKGIYDAINPNDGSMPEQTPVPETPQQQQPNEAELLTMQAEMPQAVQGSKNLAQSYQQALQGTIMGRQMLQDPQFQQGIAQNAIHGLAPEIDETGSMNFQPAMDQSKKMVAELSNGVQQALMAEGGVAPIQEAVSRAKADVRERLAPTEWAQADKEIDSAAQSYSKAYGDGKGGMTLGHFQQMKQETGHGKKWGVLDTSTKKEAYKSLSKGARRTIEEHTQHKELYNRAMKEEQKLINGQKVMKRLNGKKAPKNEGLLRKVLHAGGKYAALYIGDKIGGPMGAILGSMVGDYVIRATDKKFGKTVFETPAVHETLKILQAKSPATYRIIKSELKKAGVAVPKQKAKSPAKKPFNMNKKPNFLNPKSNPVPSRTSKSALIPQAAKQSKKSPSKSRK